MTVFVDDMRAPFRPAHRGDRRFVMSHMISDDSTFAELHVMAARIGVARCWFQGDHYDVTQTKRSLAIAAGAIPITWRQAGEIMGRQRARRLRTISIEAAITRPAREK